MVAGSVAVAPLLGAPARPARVLAAFPGAVYLQVEGTVDAAGGVVALLAADAVRLPVGLVVAEPTAQAPFADIAPGDRMLVGDGAVRAGHRSWRVGRWWDPRVPVLSGHPADAWHAGHPPHARQAPTGADVALDTAVKALVGLGPGLTPAGDDVLCGVLAALTALGDLPRRDRLAAAVEPHLTRTTTLSAALLRAAAAGHGLPQLTRLLCAVLRGEPADRVAQALTALLAVGHTSGVALAAGALLTLRAGVGDHGGGTTINRDAADAAVQPSEEVA